MREVFAVAMLVVAVAAEAILAGCMTASPNTSQAAQSSGYVPHGNVHCIHNDTVKASGLDTRGDYFSISINTCDDWSTN
jgi:hypothetical protein